MSIGTAALETNLKGARPTRQRERVLVSIPTFPGGTGSVFFCPGLSCSRRLANKPGREVMLLMSCSANCQLFTLKFPSLVLSHAHLEVSQPRKACRVGMETMARAREEGSLTLSRRACPPHTLTLWPWTKSLLLPSHPRHPRPFWDQVPPSPGVPPLLSDETLFEVAVASQPLSFYLS